MEVVLTKKYSINANKYVLNLLELVCPKGDKNNVYVELESNKISATNPYKARMELHLPVKMQESYFITTLNYIGQLEVPELYSSENVRQALSLKNYVFDVCKVKTKKLWPNEFNELICDGIIRIDDAEFKCPTSYLEKLIESMPLFDDLLTISIENKSLEMRFEKPCIGRYFLKNCP